ncbi:hypothetical protein MRX96_058244 [Rhipicephalus microplus]
MRQRASRCKRALQPNRADGAGDCRHFVLGPRLSLTGTWLFFAAGNGRDAAHVHARRRGIPASRGGVPRAGDKKAILSGHRSRASSYTVGRTHKVFRAGTLHISHFSIFHAITPS